MESTKSRLLTTARYNFNQSAKRLGVDESMRLRLCEPKERIDITLNPTLPNGKMLQMKSFIVRHRDTLGPAKGGIRMTDAVSIEDIEGLAMEMTWKTSLIGVPFGGGKSGICFDPSNLNPAEKETIIRSFTRASMRHIGPEIYVPAPDMGTNERDMGHIRDCLAYSWGTSITSGCFVTGKPVILGGIVGRKEATGKGVVYATLAACEQHGIEVSSAKVAVQGFGNVGSVSAKAIANAGAKIVAVSDVHGGTSNAEGLNLDKLLQWTEEGNRVGDFPDGNQISNEDLITSECDILIPAATQSQITQDNCGAIQAKIIAEGANAPTEPEADQELVKRGVFIIPDILCNAGGVFVSYLEYTQETQREQMTIEEVNNRLEKRMREKFLEVHSYAEKNGLSMREAAMNISVQRVLEGTYAMGLLP